MNRERTRFLVRGILAEAGVEVLRQDEGDGYLIHEGSAIVALDFYDWQDGQSVVAVHADVLLDLRLTSDGRMLALETLNARNLYSQFGKFFLDEHRDAIVLEYDLLADGLDPEELLNALHTVAQLADHSDEELREVLGTGIRAIDISAQREAAQVRDAATAEA